jgi:methionyl-tRNA synthetase
MRKSVLVGIGLAALVSLPAAGAISQTGTPWIHVRVEEAKKASKVSVNLPLTVVQAALQAVWSLVTRANQYVDHTAPFKLAKDPAQAKRLDDVLYNLAEACRVLAVLLGPFLPGTTAKIYNQLALGDAPDKFEAAQWGRLAAGHCIGTPAPLFPRKEP